MIILSAITLLLWAAVLIAPWRPWSTRERLEAAAGASVPDQDLSDVTALVPARNEAERIAATLRALSSQGRGLRIVVVDDGSEDGTPEAVEGLGLEQVSLLRAGPLPRGWSGKVWAQHQAQPLLGRPLLLLLDADIVLAPGMLPALKAKLLGEGAGLVSVMAELPMKSFWERLLLPAFVFFFKLIYPFRLVDQPGSRVAAAAGGCVLMRTRALEDVGGFAALKQALIDDCALARLVKRRGHRVWIGLSRSARSTRRYFGLAHIWRMVARNAYTQLGYSLPMLILCTLLMTAAFVIPVAGLFAHDVAPVSLSVLAMTLMAAAYAPTLGFYGRSPLAAVMLPLAGVLFLAMTWSSAIRYWAGERSVWHGRVYRT